MARRRGYYRQFEELSPEEISRELRERRDAARAPARRDVLDLSGAAWHEPPHAEVVNAATFALRRAVNAYPDAAPLRAAVAGAHGVADERVVIGHGAGELLRAALRALARGGGVRMAWPGWGPLPRLAREAGGRPLAVDPAALLTPGGSWSDAPARVLVLSRPADPTGAVMALDDVRELARRLAHDAWLVLDEALAGFLPDGEDAIVDHPRVVHVRSFSKAHAMAGFRVGYAVVPDGAEDLAAALAPVGGVGAPALAGALWAVESGADVVRRRRFRMAHERTRLADALARGSVGFAAGHGPYVWLSSSAHSGAELTERLAARRIRVAPGTAWGDEDHVRATLRDAAATDRLAAALA
jgi:histidinol-phosphate/aromatic aminotransferase/cobyric acid decarboxylase-like protein